MKDLERIKEALWLLVRDSGLPPKELEVVMNPKFRDKIKSNFILVSVNPNLVKETVFGVDVKVADMGHDFIVRAKNKPLTWEEGWL